MNKTGSMLKIHKSRKETNYYKMRKLFKYFGIILFTSTILTSCSSNKYDLSTPEATFNTLVLSSNENDKDGLSLCFSKQSAGEFEQIVNKSLSDKDLKDLKEMFGNATIKSSQINGNNALVFVKLSNRDEEISMVKENENWVIIDF